MYNRLRGIWIILQSDVLALAGPEEPQRLFITCLGVPIRLKALIFFTCKSLLKEVGLAGGEMALKSVFKDLGPRECATSVEHRAAGRQQVPRCLYPSAVEATKPRSRVKGHEPALRHQEGVHTTEGAHGSSGAGHLRACQAQTGGSAHD